MSHPTDDQRILAEIERGLTHDDPALATRITTLYEQFPQQQPEQPANVRAPRRDPRLEVAVVLSVIAVLALILTVALSSPSAPPDGEDNRPQALPVAVATHWAS